MSEIDENEFRDIPNFEGLYQINRKGQVKSLEKIDEAGKLRKEKMLKNHLNDGGYYTTKLYKNKKYKRYLTHILLYKTFISDYDQKYLQIDHINRIRCDNSLDNIRLVSCRDNNNNRTDQSSFGCSVKKKGEKYCCRLRIIGKKTHLGVFETPEEAHKKYLEVKKQIEEIEKITRNYDFKRTKIGYEYFIEFFPIL